MRGYTGAPGAQLHYRREGSGPVAVLLHQAPSSHLMWEAVVPLLAGRGYDVIAVDLPGHGMSDPLGPEPTIDDYADAVAASLVELGVERYHLVGHHTGVAVALSLATRHGEHVERIVSWGVPMMDAAGAERLATEAGPEYDREGNELLARWRRLWGYATSDAALPHVAVRTLAEVLLTGDRRPEPHRALGRADVAGMIRALRVPMLALAGTNEMLRAESEATTQLSPLVSYRELGDNGFYVPDEAPEELVEAIDAFLSARD